MGRKLENEFSFSKSKYGLFKECLRKFYFRYFESWGGWESGAPERKRKAYILGKLQNRFTFPGSAVHNFCKDVLLKLKSGNPLPDIELAKKAVLNEMREDFKNSKSGGYWKAPKSCGLFEHEYKKIVEDSEWIKVREKVLKCMENFYSMPYVQKLIKDPKSFMEIEDLSNITINGVKVFVQLDFSAIVDGKLYIVDWKSGKAGTLGAKDQLALYALYARDKWNYKHSDVITAEVNLATGEVFEYVVTQKDIDKVQKDIIEHSNEIASMIEDQKTNKPFNEEMYPGCGDYRTCQYCSFSQICPVKTN